MTRHLRSILAGFVALVVCATSAAPAAAYSADEHANTPIVFDALIVRPLGIATFLFGTALFVGSIPLVLVTRPTDIGTPFSRLVVAPARFVWGDELGGH